MNKDKAWAIKGTETNIDLWKSYIGSGEDEYAKGRLTGAKEMLSILEQLDEPEITLEQAWEVIAEDYELPSRHLKNSLNQKIYKDEPELPVIPQFVADWIEARKEVECTFIWSITSSVHKATILNWLREDRSLYEERENLLLSAWFDGYTIAVEEEKKWVVSLISDDDSTKGMEFFFTRFWRITPKFEADGDYNVENKDVILFKNKKEADGVAFLVGGEVKEFAEVVKDKREGELK